MRDFLWDILSATAFTMEKASAYGTVHLGFLLPGLAVCLLAAWKLRKLGDRGIKRLLLCCGAFLFLTELYKQLFHCVYLWEGEYNWGIFPFHFCSVPMYFSLIAPMLPKGRAKRYMYSFMGLYNLLGGGLALFEPSGLLHVYWTLTVHAFLWHLMLVFIGLVLLLSGNAGDYRGATLCFLALCVVAFCINLAFREASGGALNMFFVGPSDSPIIVFREISETFGWYVSTAIYVPAVCLGAWLIHRIKLESDKKHKRIALGEKKV